jgi:ABC-type sugar transport system ATPase subunit
MAKLTSATAPAPGGPGSVLRLASVTKTFPGARVLAGVDLDIGEAEIHALIGQNGSGKSTLIKIIAGYHGADPGSRAWVNGSEIDISRPTSARHDRLRFVHQDLGLFLELSATDNLALRGEFLVDRLHRVRWRAQADLTRTLLDRFAIGLDVNRPLSEATPVQRTIVAIAAALAGWEGGAGLLVLDEPTAVLPPKDSRTLLRIVRQLRDSGTSILYVSHRLDEVLQIADRVTILRGGNAVATCPVADLDAQSLAHLMVGADVDPSYRARLPSADTRAVVMRARGIRGPFLDGVDLDVHKGEVVGIAGLPGSGRSELPYALAGALNGVKGSMQLGGDGWRPLTGHSNREISLVPADRAQQAIVAEFSAGENLTLSILSRFCWMGWVRKRRERAEARAWLDTVKVQPPAFDLRVTALSGGNQQKVVVARCLAQNPPVLVLCEPTAGVDVGARQAIYEFLAGQALGGLGMVVSSSDTGDLLAICNRVVVMCNGRAVREISGDEITESAILHAMEEFVQV